MAKEPSEELFDKYKKLIGFAANKYAASSPFLDADDLFQDGCVLMLEFFRGRWATEDPLVHNTFKKSIWLWLSKTARRVVERATPNRQSINVYLDRIFASADTSVLVKVYVSEFMAELRRILKPADLMALEILVDSVCRDEKFSKTIRRVQEAEGVSRAWAYRHVMKVKEVVRRVWLGAA